MGLYEQQIGETNMIIEHLPALLCILGFISVLAASSIGPRRLYQEPDVNRQLELVAEQQTAWIASNVFFALAGLLTAAGLVLFAGQLRESGHAGVAIVGSAAFALGSAAYAIFLYRRTVDPAALFASYSFSPLTVFTLASLVLGLLLMGVSFLQAGYPAWLGIVTIAGMFLVGGMAMFFPTQFFDNFPPQALFLFTLVAGIVIW